MKVSLVRTIQVSDLKFSLVANRIHPALSQFKQGIGQALSCKKGFHSNEKDHSVRIQK